ncbi:MAG: hypothetical protein ACI3YE_04090 [Candidatus Avispirillum sp.]
MNRVLDELSILIAKKFHYSALFLSLALIDTCAKIEYPKMKPQKKPFYNDYMKWIDNFYIPMYEHTPSDPIITANDMYTLRCKILHEGTIFLNNSDCTRIILTQGMSHRNIATISDGKTKIVEKQLNVDRFLEEIIAAITAWASKKEEKQLLLDFNIISGKFSSTELNGSQVFSNCD